MQWPEFGWQDIVVATVAAVIGWLAQLVKRIGGVK